MKKLKYIIMSLAMLVALLLCSCTVYTYSEQKLIEKDGVTYVASLKKDVCYATKADMSLDNEEIVITIPDSLESGHKVVGIGGNNGDPVSSAFESYYNFHFETDDVALEIPESNAIPEYAGIDEYTIIVNIGKNVKYIQADYGFGENQQQMIFKVRNANRYVKYKIFYNVDGGNKNLYSENGILYVKEK